MNDGVPMTILKAEHRFEAFLPRSSCSQDVYDEVERIHRESGISKAEVVRQAVEFFLSHINQKVENKNAKNGTKKQRAKTKPLAE
jgi:hypothetical protein